jgi:hypothetical protein
VNINLKIEILKVFTLEFSLSSDKKKKEEDSAKKEPDTKPTPSK